MKNEIKRLKRQLEIKNRYLQLIVDIGFDYDGYSSIEDLKKLIDELCYYANIALENDDISIVKEKGDVNGNNY